jgi:hypothetical protein
VGERRLLETSVSVMYTLLRWHVEIYPYVTAWVGRIVEMMQNPIYAGAYAFGRRTHRVQVVDGRPRKSIGTGNRMQSQ